MLPSDPPAPPRKPPPKHHWTRGHKSFCKAVVLSATVEAKLLRDSRKAFEAEQCLICLEPPTNPTSLPCGHAFCTECVAELRKKGVSDVCPLCRAPLPPGREKLYELALRVRNKLERVADPTRDPALLAWPPLSPAQQKEMDGAIVMAQEAMDQVSGAWAGAIPASALTRLYGTLHAGPHRGC